jgi:hypothetical protein
MAKTDGEAMPLRLPSESLRPKFDASESVSGRIRNLNLIVALGSCFILARQ